jgi:L-malate glycosyltransferase
MIPGNPGWRTIVKGNRTCSIMMADSGGCNDSLRVMHIASGDLWAGAETQIYTLLSQLTRSEAVVLTAVILNHGELARRLHETGVPVEILDESVLGSFAIAREIRRRIRKFQPHVIHTHRRKENVLGAVANLTTARVPMVRTLHGAAEHMPRWHQPGRLLAATLDDWTAKLTGAAVIGVSPALAADLAAQHGLGRVHLIENGIDRDAVIGSQRPSPFRIDAPHAIHVGFAGRLEQVKRVDIFLEIAALLRCEQPDRNWQFHVYGEGSLLAQLQRHRDSLGAKEYVTFHGHVTDVMHFLGDLDALVLCSDHEGMPMIVLEAMAAGVPVVAHAVGGVRVLLEQQGCAALINSQNPRDYIAPLGRLAIARAAARPIAAAGYLSDHYDAHENARRTQDLYRTLCAEFRSAR